MTPLYHYEHCILPSNYTQCKHLVNLSVRRLRAVTIFTIHNYQLSSLNLLASEVLLVSSVPLTRRMLVSGYGFPLMSFVCHHGINVMYHFSVVQARLPLPLSATGPPHALPSHRHPSTPEHPTMPQAWPTGPRHHHA